jgi:hypothetical protein
MSNYIEVTPFDVCGMKYVPLTSVDVDTASAATS